MPKAPSGREQRWLKKGGGSSRRGGYQGEGGWVCLSTRQPQYRNSYRLLSSSEKSFGGTPLLNLASPPSLKLTLAAALRSVGVILGPRFSFQAFPGTGALIPHEVPKPENVVTRGSISFLWKEARWVRWREGSSRRKSGGLPRVVQPVPLLLPGKPPSADKEPGTFPHPVGGKAIYVLKFPLFRSPSNDNAGRQGLERSLFSCSPLSRAGWRRGWRPKLVQRPNL
ncbi:hypothetical protein GWK47_013933 [Chionoecetes opilio]|uniref:Uncharacterized protein n=1 Tax=Chionoecetes opilio TaxID=41210 RepID=A0A8J4XTR1_CHIOP|nr:hypothetical protein GWK47_013933 [Chionoecetes opilio]